MQYKDLFIQRRKIYFIILVWSICNKYIFPRGIFEVMLKNLKKEFHTILLLLVANFKKLTFLRKTFPKTDKSFYIQYYCWLLFTQIYVLKRLEILQL